LTGYEGTYNVRYFNWGYLLLSAWFLASGSSADLKKKDINFMKEKEGNACPQTPGF